MPLYRKFETGLAKIALWQIEEPASFFEPFVPEPAHPQNENRRVQWLASRYLVHKILGIQEEIKNDANGKPLLTNSACHLSVSHTARFAAAIIHPSAPVAIDVEALHPKVLRIAHKFLREDEIDAIALDEQIDKIMLYWSAKESLYKLYGAGGLEFKTQLVVEPFEFKQKGALSAQIITPNFARSKLVVHYEFFEGHVLTHIAQ